MPIRFWQVAKTACEATMPAHCLNLKPKRSRAQFGKQASPAAGPQRPTP